MKKTLDFPKIESLKIQSNSSQVFKPNPPQKKQEEKGLRQHVLHGREAAGIFGAFPEPLQQLWKARAFVALAPQLSAWLAAWLAYSFSGISGAVAFALVAKVCSAPPPCPSQTNLA